MEHFKFQSQIFPEMYARYYLIAGIEILKKKYININIMFTCQVNRLIFYFSY